MATVHRLVLCHRVITDSDTNSVTLVDCIESLAPKRLPARLPRVILATLWQRSNADEDGDATRARLQLISPSGDVLADHELPTLDFREGQKRLRLNLNLQGLEIEEAGMHRVNIETLREDAWQQAATISFEIIAPPEEDEDEDGEEPSTQV